MAQGFGTIQLLPGSFPSSIPSVIVNLADEAVTLLNAMTVQPNAIQKAAINNAIIALKNAGLWTKAKALFFPQSHDVQAAYLNWKTPGTGSLIPNGTVTFTPKIGITGDGTTGYWDLGTTYSALGVTTSSGAVSCGYGVGSGTVYGAVSSSLPTTMFAPNTAGDGNTRYQSSAAAVALNFNSGDTNIIVSRQDNTGYAVYEAGALNVAITEAGAALQAGNITIGRFGSSFGTHPTRHFGVWAPGLSAAEAATLSGIIVDYKTAYAAS